MEHYNIRLSFKGEDSLKFVLGVMGEVIIYAGKDLYIEGASASLIESLRGLKPLGLEITIGGKADGCYKTYYLSKFIPRHKRAEITSGYAQRVDKVSTADVKDIIANTTEMLEEIDEPEEQEVKEPEKVKEEVKEEILEEQEEVIEEEPEVEELSLEDYVITTEKSSAEGKKLKSLSKAQLRGLLRYLNDEDKEAVKKYLEK